MDISSVLSTVLSSSSVNGIASASGATKKEVTSVLTSALPSLIGGMSSQASDEGKAAGFLSALQSHAGDSTSNLSSFFKNVDLKDGAKIVSHLLGSSEKEETASISKAAGVSKAKTSSILSAAAPLLMSILGKKTEEEAETTSSPAGNIVSSLLGNLDVGSLLTNVLTSNSSSSKPSSKPASSSSSSSGNLLGSLLGKLFK